MLDIAPRLQCQRKKRQLDCSVDKSLIGGVKVTVDGKVIDGSVKQKLHELKGAMYR